jgi:hypothetical protein
VIKAKEFAIIRMCENSFALRQQPFIASRIALKCGRRASRVNGVVIAAAVALNFEVRS